VKSALASFYDAVYACQYMSQKAFYAAVMYTEAALPIHTLMHAFLHQLGSTSITQLPHVRAFQRLRYAESMPAAREASPILSAKLPSTLREPSFSLPDSHLLRAPAKLNTGTSRPSLPPYARASTRAHALNSNWNLSSVTTSPTCITPPGGLRASAATSALAGAASVQHNDPHGLNRPDRKHLSHTQPPTWACHPPTASPSTKLSPGTASAKAAPRPAMPHGRSGGHAPGAQVTAHSTPTWARAHAQPPTPARRPPAPRRR